MYKATTNAIAKCKRYQISKFIHKKFSISYLPVQKFWWGADRALIGKNVAPKGKCL